MLSNDLRKLPPNPNPKPHPDSLHQVQDTSRRIQGEVDVRILLLLQRDPIARLERFTQFER